MSAAGQRVLPMLAGRSPLRCRRGALEIGSFSGTESAAEVGLEEGRRRRRDGQFDPGQLEAFSDAAERYRGADEEERWLPWSPAPGPGDRQAEQSELAALVRAARQRGPHAFEPLVGAHFGTAVSSGTDLLHHVVQNLALLSSDPLTAEATYLLGDRSAHGTPLYAEGELPILDRLSDPAFDRDDAGAVLSAAAAALTGVLEIVNAAGLGSSTSSAELWTDRTTVNKAMQEALEAVARASPFLKQERCRLFTEVAPLLVRAVSPLPGPAIVAAAASSRARELAGLEATARSPLLGDLGPPSRWEVVETAVDAATGAAHHRSVR